MSISQQVEDIITDPLLHKGYNIVRVQLSGEIRKTLQIMIERIDEQTITVDDCAEASRTISALLDVENIMKSQYVLEVSSPGLDRPLVKLVDFKKFLGKPATIKTIHAINNRKNFSGKLESVEENAITLIVDQTSPEEEGSVKIDFENISSGRLQVIF